MDIEYSRIDITRDLKTKYPDYLRPEIIAILIGQSDEDVWLETLSVVTISDKGWKKESIKRINLDFISDGDDDDILMFAPSNSIEYNASKFIDELTPYSIIMTTDLFTDEAGEIINDNFHIYGIDK